MQYSYYQCLLRRLPKTHEKYSSILDSIARIDTGQAGEERVARELTDIPYHFITLKNYQCFSPQNTPHQIDFILLSQYFALILEVKHIAGDLSFQSESNEFYRVRENGQIDYFRNPFDQGFRHQQLLEQLFKMWKIPIPVTYAVVITNTNSRIGTTFKGLPIFHVSHLRVYLNQLTQKFPSNNINLNALKDKLLQNSVVLQPRKLVDKSELITGIICKVCHSKMDYSHGISTCANCQHHTRDGIHETLRDYYFLVDSTVSNSEFRWFSEIDSKAKVSKILSRLPLEKTGTHRSTRYIIGESFLQQNP